MLPDRSVLIGHKLVENAKIGKLKCAIFSNFQTMCACAQSPRLGKFDFNFFSVSSAMAMAIVIRFHGKKKALFLDCYHNVERERTGKPC